MELIIIVLIVLGCAIAVIANRASKASHPVIETKIEQKQARDANGRFVKKGKK